MLEVEDLTQTLPPPTVPQAEPSTTRRRPIAKASTSGSLDGAPLGATVATSPPKSIATRTAIPPASNGVTPEPVSLSGTNADESGVLQSRQPLPETVDLGDSELPQPGETTQGETIQDQLFRRPNSNKSPPFVPLLDPPQSISAEPKRNFEITKGPPHDNIVHSKPLSAVQLSSSPVGRVLASEGNGPILDPSRRLGVGETASPSSSSTRSKNRPASVATPLGVPFSGRRGVPDTVTGTASPVNGSSPFATSTSGVKSAASIAVTSDSDLFGGNSGGAVESTSTDQFDGTSSVSPSTPRSLSRTRTPPTLRPRTTSGYGTSWLGSLVGRRTKPADPVATLLRRTREGGEGEEA